VDVALAAGAAGAHLGHEDPPLDSSPPHVRRLLLGLSVAHRRRRSETRLSRTTWSVGPCFATANKADAGAPLGVEGSSASRGSPRRYAGDWDGGVTATQRARPGRAPARPGIAVIGAVWALATRPLPARALRAAIA